MTASGDRIVLPSAKRWCCPKGHEWRDTEPNEVTVGRGNDVKKFGPLCYYCWGEALKEQFPASRVEEA